MKNGSHGSKGAYTQVLFQSLSMVARLKNFQGDPLTPFLFNIVVEGLSGMMREAKLRGEFKGFEMGEDKVVVDLVKYANGTLFLEKQQHLMW